MREIKFRFWDTVEKKWMVDGREETSIYDFAFKPNMNWRFLTIGQARDRVIIEQYTGLKDKNGKEIYEGDWVKMIFVQDGGGPLGYSLIESIEFEGVVVWDGAGFCLDTKGDGVPEVALNGSADNLEIIGNIHSADAKSVTEDLEEQDNA